MNIKLDQIVSEERLRKMGIIEVTPDRGLISNFFYGAWEGFKLMLLPLVFILTIGVVLIHVKNTENLAFLNILWIHFIVLCYAIGDSL